MPAGTLCFSGDGPVGRDSLRWNSALDRQKAQYAFQRRHLPRRRGRPCEIAHEADADAVFIVVVIRRLAVRAMLLFVPSGTHFDESIRRIRPIAYDEMVAQLVPTFFSVESVECSCAARSCRAVVDHDGLPSRADATTTRHPCTLGRRLRMSSSRLV